MFTRGHSTFPATLTFALFVTADGKNLKLRTHILLFHTLLPSAPILVYSDMGFPLAAQI